MFCPNCGSKSAENAKYCMECGAKLPCFDPEAPAFAEESTGLVSGESPSSDAEKEASVASEAASASSPSVAAPVSAQERSSSKGGGLKAWIESNHLRAVLVLIAGLFGILIITLVITALLGLGHYRDRYNDGSYDDYYYENEYNYDHGYDANAQWYDENWRDWEEAYNDAMEEITATVPQGYTVSYGKALRNGFHYGSWSYDNYGAYDSDNEVLCSYQGTCLYNGDIVDAVVTFGESADGGYEIATVTVDGRTLKTEEIPTFVEQLYQKYAEDKGHDTPQS